MVCTALRRSPAKPISHEFKSCAALVPLLKDIKAEIERRKKADEITTTLACAVCPRSHMARSDPANVAVMADGSTIGKGHRRRTPCDNRPPVCGVGLSAI
jgi:hypothetical protein